MFHIPRARKTPAHDGGTRGPLTSPHGSSWLGFVLVAAGWSGIGLVYWIVGSTIELANRTVVLAVAGLSLVSLAFIAAGVILADTAACSPSRRVFRSRVLFGTAAVFLMVAIIGSISLLARSPFDKIASHGKPLAELMGELAFVIASLTCAIGGIAALCEGWKAGYAERMWTRQI